MIRRPSSSLSCLVVLVFVVLSRCDGTPRIYQSRIVSLSNNRVILETFEVVGLASVELNSPNRPTYYFVCNTTLNNGTGISWTREGSAISNSMVESIPTSSNGLRLTGITSASHLGVYFCLDNYSNTSVSINITQENPAVQPVSGVLRIMEGSNATVRVYVSGYPLVTSDKIRWYQPNGSEILEDEVMFENERRSFVMSNVQASYAGLYLCQITTSYGNSSTSIQVEVYGSSPLKVYQGRISAPPQSTVTVAVFPVQALATVEFITTVTYYLDCNTSRNDGSGIMWTRVGGENPFQVTAIANDNGQRLNVVHLSESSLGLYECFDTISEDRASINITTENPAVSAVSEQVKVLEGDHAVLEVHVSSFPLVTSDDISWYRPNGSKIIERNGVEFMNDGRALFLVGVQTSAAGSYRCKVNVPGTDKTKSIVIQLEVHENSLILSHPRALTIADEWTNTALQCIASGNPPPAVTWEKEGGAAPPTTVTTSTDTRNRVTSTLVFKQVRYRDRGRYRCVADNGQTPQVKSDFAEIRVNPKLIVAINISAKIQSFQSAITITEGSEVTLECFGSGGLQWSVSTGQEIATHVECQDLYQEYVSSREVQLLHIRNFSSSNAATYTCRSNLTTNGRDTMEIVVSLMKVNDVQTTPPPPQAESAVAIVGGVLAGLFLAMIVMLFVVIVLLIKWRKHETSVVIGFDGNDAPVNQLENDDIHLTSVKTMSEQSTSMEAGSSIEKLNDPPFTTAEPMNNLL